MKLRLLNHASVLIETGPVRLLTDPWFWGTCFDGGWGLRWSNPAALDTASTATHLWISHPHGDHLHVPTLKALLERNPDLVAVGNRSVNFQLDSALEGLGFRNVVVLEERRPLPLADGVVIERFPTTGIDNMLVLRSGEGTVLDYNDCVVPEPTRRALRRRIGAVDVMLCNFNHAGKLLKHPLPPALEMKRALRENFAANVGSFSPRWAVPFASHHQYLAPESAAQNESLLVTSDLAGFDPRVVPLRVGETAEFGEGEPRISGAPCAPAEPTPCPRDEGHDLVDLCDAAARFCQRLREGFPGLHRLLTPLRIGVADLDEVVSLHPRRGLEAAGRDVAPHITAHSQSLWRWFDAPYGTDSFVVGAHFSLADPNVGPLKKWIVGALLVENRLDPRTIARMTLTGAGWRFLANRREEALGILRTGRIGADYHR